MAINNIQRDRELFIRIAEGDGAAFRVLFDLYYDRLRGNSFKLLKNEFWAEEVAQEVLTKVWDKRRELLVVDNPGGWLFRVCANECLDRTRRQERQWRFQYLMHMSQQGSPSESLHPRYDMELLQKLVQEAMEQMSPQQRLVYQLQQNEDLTYREIGQRLDISHHTVRNHLIRAYQIIRDHVLAHGEFFILLYAFLPFSQGF